MADVHPRVFNGADEPRSVFHLKRSDAFDREFVHGC
jgi:hypothetical protein